MTNGPQFPIGPAPYDDALFRAAGIRCWAEIEGQEYDLQSLVVSTEVSGMPRASFGVALGRQALPEGQQVLNAEQVFVRYTELKLQMSVSSMVSERLDVRPALLPGNYLLFEGLVEGAIPSRSNNAISLMVTAQHRMAFVMSGTTMISPYLPSTLIEADFVYNGGFSTISGSNFRAKDALWLTITEILTDLTKRLSQENKYPTVKAVFDRIRATSAASIEQLSEIKSDLLQLSVSDEGSRQKAINLLVSVFQQGIKQRPSIWNMLVDLGQNAFSYVFTATNRDLWIIPFNPFVVGSDMKTAPAGSFMQIQPSDRANGDPMIGATIVLNPAPGGYVATDKGKTRETGAYAVPSGSIDDRYMVAALVNPPQWLIGTSAPGEHNSKKPVGPTSGQGAADILSIEDIVEGTNGLAVEFNRYARLQTLQALFAQRSLQVTCGLRMDVVPGQCLRIDTQSPDGSITPCFGWVSGVQHAISPSHNQASTTISLQFVRGQSDQEKIVEQGDTAHFCWQDKSQDIANIAWAEAE